MLPYDMKMLIQKLPKIAAPDPKTRVETITEALTDARIILFDGESPCTFHNGQRYNLKDDEARVWIRNLLAGELKKETSTAQIKEIYARCKDNLDLQLDTTDNAIAGEYCINTLDGLLDLTQQRIVEKVEGYIPDYQLDFHYRPRCSLDNAPTFAKFIRMSLGIQQELIVLQVLGSCISSLLHCRAIFLLVGKGGTGKSTFLDLLEAVIPPGMVSHEPLHRIGSEQAKAHYRGRRLNIGRDTRADAIGDEESIKNLASCEWTTSRELYQCSRDFVPTLKFIYASNHFPQFKHVDDALLDRLVIITFSEDLREEDKDTELLKKLLDEKDIIFSLACDALLDLISNNFHYAMGEKAQAHITQQRHMLHSVDDFFEEALKLDVNGSITSKQMFGTYKGWCAANEIKAVSSHDFINTITLNHPTVKYGKVGPNYHRLNGFKGVCLKNVSTDEDDS